MSHKKLSYDWVCHACKAENSKQAQQCQVCGYAAFASMQSIKNHESQQRKAEFQLSREQTVQVLFWVVTGIIVLLFKFALMLWI
ncbi:hypothetical protein ACO0LF_05510 [Undibacterium sp. Di27W]|uniref:hypothetical protein n=1 Tax=Undibacterium sp. Di27W TaxID=3413036 RepID=UPI003BF356C5